MTTHLSSCPVTRVYKSLVLSHGALHDYLIYLLICPMTKYYKGIVLLME